MKSTVYYTVRRKKTNKRKKNKSSRKIKKVKKSKMIIKKQKGGEFTERPSYTFLEDSEGRFEFNNLNSKINRIIDKKYNNQYLFEKKTQQKNDLTQKKKGVEKLNFCVLVEPTGNYYAFDEDGLNIKNGTTNVKKIEDIFEIINDDIVEIPYSTGIEVQDLINKKGCYTPINLDVVKEKIVDLNRILNTKCPNLELQCDNYYNLKGHISVYEDIPFDGVIICLYYNGNCISSITLQVAQNGIVKIESQTDEHFQGKGFNKLLRCVAVIISAILICNDTDAPFKILRSEPVNPVSAWLLISNFKTNIMKIGRTITIDENYETQFSKLKEEELSKTKKKKGENTQLSADDDFDNEIKKKLVFKNKYKFGLIDVPLDAENVENAVRIFNELDIECPPLPRTVLTKTKKKST